VPRVEAHAGACASEDEAATRARSVRNTQIDDLFCELGLVVEASTSFPIPLQNTRNAYSHSLHGIRTQSTYVGGANASFVRVRPDGLDTCFVFLANTQRTSLDPSGFSSLIMA
jgi:hypothetical protein